MPLNLSTTSQLLSGYTYTECLLWLRDQQISFLNLHGLIICKREHLALFFKSKYLHQIIQL